MPPTATAVRIMRHGEQSNAGHAYEEYGACRKDARTIVP